jgi:hypothetical protein
VNDSEYPLLPRALIALIALGFLLLTDPAGVAPWFRRSAGSEEDAAETVRRQRGIRRVKLLGLATLPTFGAMVFRRDPIVLWGCIAAVLWLGYRAFTVRQPGPAEGNGDGAVD